MTQKVKLTQRSVASLPVPTGSRVRYWDADLPGFGLRVTPTGAKVYIAVYRTQGGRAGTVREVTIGPHGKLTAEMARTEAKRMLGQAAVGGDPAAVKAQARADITVGELCDLYLQEGTAFKKASTIRSDRGRIEHHIRPALGSRPLRTIVKADIQGLHDDIAAGRVISTKQVVRRPPVGGKGVAGQVKALCGALFSFAIEREIYIAKNPADGVKVHKPRKMERFLSSVEMSRLGEALIAMENNRTHPSVIAAIRLLALTGARKSEILGLEWEWIDLERGIASLPDSKTGKKALQLPDSAISIIQMLPREEGNPYVLIGHIHGKPIKDIDKGWREACRQAGLNNVRIHDLRHSFASAGVNNGASLYMVGALLGHKQSSTTERYAHLADDPRRLTADTIGDYVAKAMRGEYGKEMRDDINMIDHQHMKTI